MAAVYLDNDISLRLAPLLRVDGHDAVAARDLGLDQADDNTQFMATVQAGRVLVTHNRRDFILLHEAWRRWPVAFGLALPAHPGILVLDQAPPDTLAPAVSWLLAVRTPVDLRNDLFWWRAGRGWSRWLVAGGWAPA